MAHNQHKILGTEKQRDFYRRLMVKRFGKIENNSTYLFKNNFKIVTNSKGYLKEAFKRNYQGAIRILLQEAALDTITSND